jgi:carbon monoxide dehydrogenase subunit G
VKLEVEREFAFAYPGTASEAIAFVRDVQRSLERVAFIKHLRTEDHEVFADLGVDVPFLGEQHIDFHSRLEPQADGANLIALPGSGKAWAEVAGQARVTPSEGRSSIRYALQIAVHLDLPIGDQWGGRAFEKMAHATAARAIERMTEQFPAGVLAAMPTR